MQFLYKFDAQTLMKRYQSTAILGIPVTSLDQLLLLLQSWLVMADTRRKNNFQYVNRMFPLFGTVIKIVSKTKGANVSSHETFGVYFP